MRNVKDILHYTDFAMTRDKNYRSDLCIWYIFPSSFTRQKSEEWSFRSGILFFLTAIAMENSTVAILQVLAHNTFVLARSTLDSLKSPKIRHSMGQSTFCYIMEAIDILKVHMYLLYFNNTHTPQTPSFVLRIVCLRNLEGSLGLQSSHAC